MFYRRKILLALLQSFNDAGSTRLQKLLFLFMQRKEIKEYDFIPYKLGCYSYSADADLNAMTARGLLPNNKVDYISQLLDNDKKALADIKEDFGKMTTNDLMKYIYQKYPYWAINSEKATSLLTASEMERVNACRPSDTSITLFTIGYEGISLEEYLNRLIKNNVKILIDVRNNPISMKFGFSKNLLKNYCEKIGVEYKHFPSLGIQTEQRKSLNNQSDYENLFANYCKNTLSKTKEEQKMIFDLLIKNKRVALTCFEANIDQCHRKHLARAISEVHKFEYEVRHI